MMGELAKANNVKPLFASILPVSDYHKGTDPRFEMTRTRPLATIRQINAWLQDYCRKEGFVFVDYYSNLADGTGQIPADMADDGLHPNSKGYRAMSPVALDALNKVLSSAGQPTTEKTRKNGSSSRPLSGLNGPAPGNDLNQRDDNGYHQQDMNEPPKRVGSHQTHQPQNNQNDEYRPKHRFIISVSTLCTSVTFTWAWGLLNMLPMTIPRIGIHTSRAGSLENAAVKAGELGANTFQIFSSSPRMWRASAPDPADIGGFAPSANGSTSGRWPSTRIIW